MNKTTYWVLAIENSISLICWVVLAIVFNKWWIALFALLFLSFIRFKRYRVCDKCGKHSPYASTNNEAIQKAREAGWITIGYNDDWETCNDICPECQTKN